MLQDILKYANYLISKHEDNDLKSFKYQYLKQLKNIICEIEEILYQNKQYTLDDIEHYAKSVTNCEIGLSLKMEN